MDSPQDLLQQALTLPNGSRLKNRLAKSAMSEALGTTDNHATEALVRLYGRWAAGGRGAAAGWWYRRFAACCACCGAAVWAACGRFTVRRGRCTWNCKVSPYPRSAAAR